MSEKISQNIFDIIKNISGISHGLTVWKYELVSSIPIGNNIGFYKKLGEHIKHTDVEFYLLQYHNINIKFIDKRSIIGDSGYLHVFLI